MGIMTPLNVFFWALGLAMVVVEAWALIDAAIRPAPAYVAADKQTKNTWLALLGIAVVVNLFFFGGGALSIFAIIGIIIALVYLVDVRPAVREVQRHGGPSQGPYGP